MRGIRNGNRVDRLTMCVECVNGRFEGKCDSWEDGSCAGARVENVFLIGYYPISYCYS